MTRHFSCDIEIINVKYPESPAKENINLKISMPKKVNIVFFICNEPNASLVV